LSSPPTLTGRRRRRRARTGIDPNTLSHHLGKLKDKGLLFRARRGRQTACAGIPAATTRKSLQNLNGAGRHKNPLVSPSLYPSP
jgi:DNA-binding transcriptional ArsR family regulator